MERFHGTGVALVTPFKKDRTIDFDGLSRLVKHVTEGGVEYLVVLGTTGESATLNTIEKEAVLKHVLAINAGNLPIVLGMGGNNTNALIEELNQTNLEGVSAILSASPNYNKPTQEGIYQHYKLLAENSKLPIILYNVPGRTASNISASTTLRLARDFETIVGIKEASADMDQVMAIIEDKPENFLVISGEDGLTFPIVACGGAGVISVVANSQAAIFSEMVRSTAMADLNTGRKKHYQLKKFIDLLFAEGNPGGVKAALKHQKICGDTMRLPLVNVSVELEEKIQRQLEKIVG